MGDDRRLLSQRRLPGKNVIYGAKAVSLVDPGAGLGVVSSSVRVDMNRIARRKRRMVEGLVELHFNRITGSGAELSRAGRGSQAGLFSSPPSAPAPKRPLSRGRRKLSPTVGRGPARPQHARWRLGSSRRGACRGGGTMGGGDAWLASGDFSGPGTSSLNAEDETMRCRFAATDLAPHLPAFLRLRSACSSLPAPPETEGRLDGRL